eukprot:284815192_2
MTQPERESQETRNDVPTIELRESDDYVAVDARSQETCHEGREMMTEPLEPDSEDSSDHDTTPAQDVDDRRRQSQDDLRKDEPFLEDGLRGYELPHHQSPRLTCSQSVISAGPWVMLDAPPASITSQLSSRHVTTTTTVEPVYEEYQREPEETTVVETVVRRVKRRGDKKMKEEEISREKASATEGASTFKQQQLVGNSLHARNVFVAYDKNDVSGKLNDDRHRQLEVTVSLLLFDKGHPALSRQCISVLLLLLFFFSPEIKRPLCPHCPEHLTPA